MKIAIVCYPTLGGGSVIATELALELAERDHEIHIVSYATPFRLRQGNHKNISIHEVKTTTHPVLKYPPYTLELSAKLLDIYKKYGLDIIHVHFAIPHAASAFLVKKILHAQNSKVITTLHGTEVTLATTDKSLCQVVKFTIEASDGVTAVSKFLQKRAIDKMNITKEIRVIYNFTDSSKCSENFREDIRRKYAPNGEKVLIHASNFRPVKRVGDAVRIFSLVCKQIQATLLLVGEGPELRSVQKLVKELGLSQYVKFLSAHDNIEPLLHCADLLLLPSELESFGLVALEAQACGVPVVGTNSGGLPEVVIDGKTGFLLPLGNISGMAQKSLKLLNNKKLSKTFGNNARMRVQKYFDKELIIPKYEAYYREVLNQED